jgi:hypothetical protein
MKWRIYAVAAIVTAVGVYPATNFLVATGFNTGGASGRDKARKLGGSRGPSRALKPFDH